MLISRITLAALLLCPPALHGAGDPLKGDHERRRIRMLQQLLSSKRSTLKPRRQLATFDLWVLSASGGRARAQLQRELDKRRLTLTLECPALAAGELLFRLRITPRGQLRATLMQTQLRKLKAAVCVARQLRRRPLWRQKDRAKGTTTAQLKIRYRPARRADLVRLLSSRFNNSVEIKAGPARADTGGMLSSVSLGRTIRRQKGAFRACHQSARQNAQIPPCTVEVRFMLSPSGGVSGAFVPFSSCSSPALESCLVTTFETMLRFPGAPERPRPLVVTYPLRFGY